MKLSDYVFRFITDLGTDIVFMVVGGANSHLADSVGRNPKIRYVCTQHEQAAAMAAEGYARASGKIGVALVTSGPGGTNAITGVCGAWCDSVPCIFISGQVPLDLTTDGKTVRQLGVQQINIVEIVRSVTKFAEMVKKPELIRHYLEEAVFKAKNGRPGPVWIDIPADIQRAQVDPDKLIGFSEYLHSENDQEDGLRYSVSQVVNMLKTACRPILIAGHGIRIAKAEAEFRELVKRLGFPVITTWNGIDLLNHDHPLYVGSAGVMGQRGANFAVANSDLILSIGSRLDTRQISGNSKSFGRAANKIIVDIDRNELDKGRVVADVPVCADAKEFIMTLQKHMSAVRPDISGWLDKGKIWKNKYPSCIPEYFNQKTNPKIVPNKQE